MRAKQQHSFAQFSVGIAEALYLPDGWADAATSTFFFHHLPSDVKPQALREMWRMLKPGGRLVLTDYARPRNLVGWIASSFMRLNFYEYVRPQLGGELEHLIEAEDIGPAEITGMFLGYITIFRVVKLI
jgi:ubiquinone/menaquinone biosynthesis C-methylase UbiE